MTDTLFDDYEEDFDDCEDEDETGVVDRSTGVTIRYALEEVFIPVEEGQTLGQALADNQSVLGFRSIEQLNVLNAGQYVSLNQVLTPGNMYVVSSATDSKGS